MFVEACRLGDQASCWHSMYVDDNEEATIACGKNCLAGHTMSCRALEESAGRPTVGDYSAEEAISLCRAGLADACIAAAGHDEANALSWYRRGCELESNAACIAGWVELGDSSPDDGWDRATWDQRGEAAAARECSRGFSSACQTVEAPSERVLELARAGCWAGLLLDCQILYEETVDDAERILAADHLCLFSVELCQELGNLRLTAKDPTLRSAQGARDAYERGCAWDLKTCFALGVLYARGQLPEPVKGRGLALVEDSCPIAEQGCDVLVELRASVPAAP